MIRHPKAVFHGMILQSLLNGQNWMFPPKHLKRHKACIADFNYWMPDGNGGVKAVKISAISVIFIGVSGAGKSRLGAWIEKRRKVWIMFIK